MDITIISIPRIQRTQSNREPQGWLWPTVPVLTLYHSLNDEYAGATEEPLGKLLPNVGIMLHHDVHS